jgi:hypothetical protein
VRINCYQIPCDSTVGRSYRLLALTLSAIQPHMHVTTRPLFPDVFTCTSYHFQITYWYEYRYNPPSTKYLSHASLNLWIEVDEQTYVCHRNWSSLHAKRTMWQCPSETLKQLLHIDIDIIRQYKRLHNDALFKRKMD